MENICSVTYESLSLDQKCDTGKKMLPRIFDSTKK